MKRTSSSIAVLAFFVAAANAAEGETPVPVKVDRLAPQVAQRVMAHAFDGKSSLIRYLNNTRMIHGLRVEDVVVDAPAFAQIDAAPARAETLLASKEDR
jgi:hypothetical protein